MIDRETAHMALTGLFGSAATLIEDIHPELVTQLSNNANERAHRCDALNRTAIDLVALAEAAAVIVRQSEEAQTTAQE